MSVQAWTFVMVGLSLRNLYRCSDLVAGKFNGGVLYCRCGCPPSCQRHGDGSRLDERCIVYFDGGSHFVHGTGWLGLSHGLDGWLCVASAIVGAVSTEVRQVHRA